MKKNKSLNSRLSNAKSLTRNESKEIMGGVDEVRDIYLCGWRWNNNQCYCDWCYQDTGTAKFCDDPCNSWWCGH